MISAENICIGFGKDWIETYWEKKNPKNRKI